ncbi:MAG: WYL domain-containing protein [Candidatus Cryptobacteroides sp.]
MTSTELEKLYQETDSNGFSSFINAVKSLKANKEMTDFALATTLSRISDNEKDLCRAIGSKGRLMTPEERQSLAKAAMLTAGCIILLCETRSRNEIRRKTMLLLEYLSYLQAGVQNLLGAAVKACSYSMVKPGYSLSLLETPSNIDILAYNICENAKFNKHDRLSPVTINSAGSVCVQDGVITISSAPALDKGIRSYSDHGDMLEVFTRNLRDEKLKASEKDDAEALDGFARDFLLSQAKTARINRGGKSDTLEKGNEYSVRVIRIVGNDGSAPALDCEPLGIEHEGVCHIKSEELVKGIYTKDLVAYLCDDDYIEGAVLLDEDEPPVLSIKNAYARYCKQLAKKDSVSKRVFQAKVIGHFQGSTPEKNRMILLSDKGYGGLMIDDGTMKIGDCVFAYALPPQEVGQALFINMAKATFDFGDNYDRFDGDDALAGFVADLETAMDNLEAGSGDAQPDSPENEIVRQLAQILSVSRESHSTVRYRDLLASVFLFNIAGDECRRDQILHRADYLNQCLRVAEGLAARPIADNQDLTDEQKKDLAILSALGSTSDICQAAELIRGMDGAKGREMSRLFMAHTLSIINRDDLNASTDSLRHKICDLLGVGDHFKGDIRKGGGKYGKGELENVEFKSSYVFHNKDGKPDLFLQGRGQVLEAVCGFMNRDGGTVYLGVNDAGDPLVSETYGLKADMAWFRDNYQSVNYQRYNQLGHSVPQPVDLDSYCRFLNYELELYFKPTVRGCVSISPTEDHDAIRFTVKPSEYEIAKLYTDNTWKEGCVYVREGEETRQMQRHAQEQRLMALRRVGKVEQFILTLNEAIDGKRKVVLKNYASGNSNSVGDRFVVPINLVYNNENLWAYDIERKSCREFRLSRIEDIVVEDSTYDHPFAKGQADVFRWVDPDVNYHIRMRMKISALNCLLEEYSDAKNLPEEELYQESPDSWILDTRLHGLEGVRRFYLGLADQIEILDTEDSEELKEAIRDFVTGNLAK